MSRRLSTKQQAFIEHYIANGGNAMQAAVDAGYSQNYAKTQSHKMLENVGIAAAIAEAREELKATHCYTAEDKGRKLIVPPDWLFNNITESIKTTRNIYFIYVAIHLYSIITVVTVKDIHFLFNEGILLPLLNIDVSMIIYFSLAPLLLIFVFTYFHLSLLNTERLIKRLETEYSSIDKDRIYPWLIMRKESENSLLGEMQVFINDFSLWWLMPLTLIVFNLGIVRHHDVNLFFIHGSLTLFSIGLIVLFWQQNDGVDVKFLESILAQRIFKWGMVLLILLFTFGFTKIFSGRFLVYDIRVLGLSGFLIFFILYSFSNKFSQIGSGKRMLSDMHKRSYGKLILIFVLVSFSLFYRFWIIPHAMNGERYYSSVSLMPNLDLLSFLDIKHQKLVAESDPERTGSYLRDLSNLNLQGADLSGSILQGVDISFSKLQRATLVGTDLKNSRLEKANLRYANLQKAMLQNVNARKAKFYKARLQKSNLSKGDFAYSDMQQSSLQLTNLQEVNFTNAVLSGANLEAADMSNAILENALFVEANLNGTIGLTADQLSKAGSLYNAQLDSTLRNELAIHYPNLFMKR